MATPRAPFDQGLFLAHFNKGKAQFDAKHYEEAERELEEAYLLRPRDQKVLNLLGLIYFKQDKYEKAEEIYRKLAAESPDVHTLYYNLGLIYFKLQRLEEAEPAFIKALELSGPNPKINFYLGSIYERMKRYQDAIFQYRQAGANILVRRVEDKLAGRERAAPPPPQHKPAGEPLGLAPPLVSRPAPAPPDAAGDAFPPALAAASPPQKPKKSGADTAEFKAAEVRDALRKEHATRSAAEAEAFPPRELGPMSSSLLAGARTSDTARLHVSETGPRDRHPEIISFPQRAAERPQPLATDRTLPANRRSEVFRFLDNNLMEIDFSGKVFIKQGTIYSYGGNLTFWVKERRPGGHPPLVMITGTGKIILTDHEREITFMHVQEEVVHVEPAHLLACEATLTPRYVVVGTGPGAAEFLALEGGGMLALSVASKPLALAVTPDMPVSVPASSIITWSGDVFPRSVEDREVYEVMLAGHEPDTLIRLEGSGRLLVEQAHR